MNTRIIETKEEFKPLFVDTFGETYFDSRSEAEIYFKKNLESKTLFLFFENDELAGFFNYIFQYSHFANYLEDISISEKFRGKGYSKKLLSKYIEISKNDKTKNNVALSSTRINNKVSQKMHEEFGFKKIGILKKLHYGLDEIFYAYELK